jgi:protein-tyrosine-phosphatase
MEEVGIDLGSSSSRHISSELMGEASVVLTMTAAQRDEVIAQFPEAGGKVFLLSALGTDPRPGDVTDPIGMNPAEYRRVRDEIDALLPDVILFLHEYCGGRSQRAAHLGNVGKHGIQT